MTAIDEIKSRLDIVDFVSQSVKLRRAGKNYTGFCPFHPNTRTPAFVVFPDSGTWRCFGQCNEGGDIFRFVMKKEGWDFNQTLKFLADKAGVVLEPLTPQKKEHEDRLDTLRGLLEQAVVFYRHHLTQTAAGKPALDFLHRRGLTDQTIETFGLGYAPDAWDAALNHFTAKGISPEDLLEAGLVTERGEGGGYYDRFRNRVLFPIHDANGRMAGFGARILNPDDVPKFLNSPQTPLFDKGRLLYGMDKARKAIRASDEAVIVEGYLDVIVLHQGGFTNTVSPMGTALTEDQLRMIKKYARRIVLALDADAAGEKATLRGLEVARQAMDRTAEITSDSSGIFNARGLVRTEGRLQADLRVTTIPEGMDPDEVVLRSPEEWTEILRKAQPIVVHVMEALAANQDLEDAKVKADIARKVMPLIEDVPNLIERDTYRQRLARLLRVDESILGGSATVARRTTVRSRAAAGTKQTAAGDLPAPGQDLIHRLEKHILAILLNNPGLIYSLNRMLQLYGLLSFQSDGMELVEHQALANLIYEAVEQDSMETAEYISQQIPGEFEEITREIKESVKLDKLTENRQLEDLFRTVLRKRQEQINREINQLRFIQQEAQEQNEPEQDDYIERILQNSQTLARINRALHEPFIPD
ncbi:MAG: DNA primase [Anaerolineaceae bacterium]|nr:DNA primase [Anaerolineaceae bacterium]